MSIKKEDLPGVEELINNPDALDDVDKNSNQAEKVPNEEDVIVIRDSESEVESLEFADTDWNWNTELELGDTDCKMVVDDPEIESQIEDEERRIEAEDEDEENSCEPVVFDIVADILNDVLKISDNEESEQPIDESSDESLHLQFSSSSEVTTEDLANMLI